MIPPRPSLTFFFLYFFLLSSINHHLTMSATDPYLTKGWTLSVERSNDTIISPDGTFSAGFKPVGDNAYCFAIWFTNPSIFTPVWMANRDQPVNGKRSVLSLQKDGKLILTNAGGRSPVWTTNTNSTSPVKLLLSNNGNLMLQNSTNNILWQSFDSPTDTLLPGQPLTRNLKLIASRSQGNFSSGYYSLYFDNDNILHLLYDGPEISSVYWPDPGLVSWEAGRSTYNSSRIAMVDLWGHFQSTDELKFYSSDYGIGPKRRLVMDFDGNLRLYSLDEKKGSWEISWQAISKLCTMHGLCGPNSICVYEQTERRCTCPPGFKLKNPSDLSQGCEPTFTLSCDQHESTFITVPNTDFYGYDKNYTEKKSLQACKELCLQMCSCKAFMYQHDGTARCFPKIMLLNGYQSSRFKGTVYIKVPRNGTVSNVSRLQPTTMNCHSEAPLELVVAFEVKQQNNSLKLLLCFVGAIGVVEMICIVTGLWFMYMQNRGPSSIEEGYAIAASGFKRFSYAELKKATRNFTEEIGRGGGGVVYKGELPDGRATAVKRLEGINQGEAEFLTEVSIIGRINHMNLIEMWGFCAERKHKLLVYEYMWHGSLAKNLTSSALDWDKRFEIAVGTAKGLAYLHEECLEWVLHCDVKPQNILLDENYNPKVADFGLSKLQDRGNQHDSSFSRIRGTRGYMAPEWISNLPITSKVDVYSYGIVVLEMVTGKSSIEFTVVNEREGKEYRSLVTWVREMMFPSTSSSTRIKEIMDSRLDVKDDGAVKMEILVRVALQCLEEDRDARPTMSQVVHMLQVQDH